MIRDRQPVSDKKADRKWNKMGIAMIAALLLSLGIAVWMDVTSEIKNMSFNDEEASMLTDEFQVETGGQRETLSLPASFDGKANEKITLTREINRSELEGDALLIYVRQAWVDIYLDGERVNGSDKEAKLPFKMSPCSYWYLCELPYEFEQGELRIEITYGKQQYANRLPAVYMGTKAAFIYMIVEQAGFSILISITTIVLGIAMVVAGLLMRIERLSRRLRRLGVLALVISIWSFLESRISQLFTGNQPLVVYILFTCFYFIPVIAAAFLMTYPSIARKRYMYGIFWLSFAYFILVQALQISGQVYFIDMVPGMHILTGLVVAGALGCFADIRRKKEKNVDFTIYRAIFLFGIFVLLDIILYYMVPQREVGSYSKVGLLVFIFYIGYSAIQQVSQQLRRAIKQQLYEELAFNDIMTGLANRTAFEREMGRLREEEPDGLCVLVADVNNLKYINDNFGHARGDEAIIRTAHELSGCFGEKCKCFRIGGDEFCVIGTVADEKEMEQMHQSFLQRMQTVNQATEYPLLVASAYKVSERIGIDACFRQADTLMYDKKAQIKRG